MEDEKGLDLSLSLPCGGSNNSQKGKYGSSSDIRTDKGDRGSKLINEFKNFLEGGNQHPLKSEDNFYKNFGKASGDSETSKNSITGETWATNERRSTEVEEEKRSSVGEKRKSPFNEKCHQKRHEKETNHPDLIDKSRTSHSSINTCDGSAAENEDVADSEVGGSTSRQVSGHDDASKCVAASGSLSGGRKELHAFGDPSGIERLGPKRFAVSSEKEFNISNLPSSYNVPFQTQPANLAKMTYAQSVKDSNLSGAPTLSTYPLPVMIHGMNSRNSDRSGIQTDAPPNLPLMFGYPSVQMPVLDKENSRGIGSHHLQVLSGFSGKNPINPDIQNDSRKLNQAAATMNAHKSFESTQYDGRAIELGKSNGKQHDREDGSLSHAEGDLTGNNMAHLVKDASNQPKSESFPSDYPAIRPGIAADLKFGGCGTYPNLPWVSTTDPRPNGRTISGVTYRYSPTQIRIVCACHGSHMSPEEFIGHATEENSTQESGAGLASLPNSNPAASAQG
ncbi:ninja-family protein mc410-like [Dorcoceras hygrometricum]|uniref:Ninja-family protein n=1 Tax=Dorcoceras hygrometricum TaxID=472368 RepID=A0A2Z7A1V9_9LAMI|nr:ninja-family protein mc410-like [Dorcoceras hygrometricum]